MNRLRYNDEDFKFIEQCFSAVKSDIGVKENLSKIERALNRIFDLNFSLNIIENNSGEFFGMSVYPTLNTMNEMVKNIVENKKDSDVISNIWAKNTDWYIEIDSILLYDTSLNANPSEIVAVLLHEVGHVVYANTIPKRLNKIFRYKMLKLNYQLRKLFSNEKIRELLNIAIAEACATKNFSFSKKAETEADRFVVYYGYGEYLDSFIGKLIKHSGNDLINKTSDEMEKDIEVIVNWTVLNIKELEYRKSSLRTALKVEILKNPSIYTKKIIQNIYNSFFGESTDKYRELLSEQYMSNPTDKYSELKADQAFNNYVQKVLTEAIGAVIDKNGKLKKINQSDIDILYVESEHIETVDDKIYLLDKTYSLLEIVELGLDYINSKEKDLNSKVTQSKTTLLGMRDQLNKIRSQILATKIIEKEWGTFVRVPKGYEG